MNKKIYTIAPYALSAIALLIAGTQVAHAIEYYPLTTIPGVFTANTPTNPVSVVKGIYGLAIGAGSVIAVVMIILAGFKYMYEESITGKSGAKEQIENAFLGLLVILGSYVLLRTINADLVNFNPELPGGTGGVSGLVADSKAAEAAAIKKAAADYAAAKANEIKPLQQNVDTLNTQLTNINKNISDIQASSTMSATQKQDQINALQAQKTTAETSLTTATAQLTKTQNTAETARITAINQVAASQLQTALASGDADAAKGVIARTQNVIDAEVKRRGGDDADTIKMKSDFATAQVEANIKGTSQNIVNKLNSGGTIIDPETGASYDTTDYSGINSMRNKFVNNAAAAINNVAKTDPAKAEQLRTEALSAQRDMDASIAKKMGCQKGYETGSNGVQCKG